MLQSVNVDNIDEPVDNVVYIHFVPLYCKTWVLAGLGIATSVIKPESAVVPETVIVLGVSSNVAPRVEGVHLFNEETVVNTKIWSLEGLEMLQSVNVDNVDEPVVNVVFIHFEPLYCKTWLFAGLDIGTSVVKPDNAVVPDTVIVLVVSLNITPDRV